MDEGVVKIAELRERVKAINLKDKSKVFNTARIEALEVENLIEAAQATIVSAAARHESRGAHTVDDYGDTPSTRMAATTQDWHEAHPVVQRRQPPELQARADEAADRGLRSTQSPYVLSVDPSREPEHDQTHFLTSTATTQTRTPSLTCRTIEVELDGHERMLLDALMKLKAVDPAISFRRSCREGVCGSDAMNINGKNGLACLTNMLTLPGKIVLKPLPGLPVIRDLIVDMTQFFKQYNSIKPYLINDTRAAREERLQSPEEREELNGLYECILCASCSTSCPSFWWNPDKFVGPAGLLQAYRFIADSRDQATGERLDNLEDPYRLFRCHTIMNCVDVCPKGLNPTKAIGKIKEMMVLRAV